MRIEDMFLMGDLHTAALISEGDIVWLCFPDFDSPSVFGSLLDSEAGSFATVDTPQHTSYVEETAVVTSSFVGYDIYDFMIPRPVQDCEMHILERTVVASEDVHVSFECSPRPGYGQCPDFTVEDSQILFPTNDGECILHLPANAEVEVDTDTIYVNVNIQQGERVSLWLEYHENGSVLDSTPYLDHTKQFWKDWVAKGDISSEKLIRSAITLKLMQYYPSGALIAAPTTSLPEDVGGIRNWDYRYTWIRDATFTLYSFTILGYREEANKFFSFIEDIIERDGLDDIRLMYTVRGEPVPEERELPFEGYKGSTPVRVGNGAAEQFQLDVYGALIDAYYFVLKEDIDFSKRAKRVVTECADTICERWNEKDSGIWEVRDGIKEFTYSKVMSWVGLDRAATLAEKHEFGSPRRWDRTANKIKDWVWNRCFQDGKLVQYPGTNKQDATSFLFVLLHFLHRDDERTQHVIDNATKELADGAFVHRYFAEDGLTGEEGAFLLCSFWMISAYARLGNTEQAETLLHELESYIPESGLIAEEIDVASGHHLGNFPQAFSHLGYVMAVEYIKRYS